MKNLFKPLAFIALLLAAVSTKAQINTMYFVDSEVVTCGEISSSNKPLDISDEWTISSTGGWVYVSVTNPKPLATDELKVVISKKIGGEYEEVETKYYEIEPEWENTYFKYTFKSKGQYEIAVYTAKDVWINSAYCTVNVK